MKDEMKIGSDDRDLRQRTKGFALRVVRMFSTLPKSTEAQVLGKQVLRSGTSVGANYREACRSRSKAEFVAKMGDCLKELDESSYWFELLEETGVATPASPAVEEGMQRTSGNFHVNSQEVQS
jgi:four helix bundle protein